MSRAKEDDINKKLLYSIHQKDHNGIREALDAGANPNLIVRGMPVLIQAILGTEDNEIINYFLQKGADPNLPDSSGDTPLIWTCQYSGTFNLTSLFEIFKTLLIHGADPNAQDNDGQTALLCATRRAIATSDDESHYSDNENRFSRALVRNLFIKKADPNIPDDDGKTPLMHAAESDYENVKMLLKNGAEVNAQDKYGQTALMLVDIRLPEITELLLQSGADPKIKDNSGKTALMHFLKYSTCHKDKKEQIIALLKSVKKSRPKIHSFKASYKSKKSVRKGKKSKGKSVRKTKKSVKKVKKSKGTKKHK